MQRSLISPAKIRIERKIRKTPELELTWAKKQVEGLKQVPGRLFKVKTIQTPLGMRTIKLPKKIRSTIHTHPAQTGPLALPSPQDIIYFLWLFRDKSVSTNHIACINKEGKVMGYTSFHINERADDYFIFKMAELIIHGESKNYSEIGLEVRKKVLDELKQRRWITIRFRPMKGYKYNAEKGQFVKKYED